MILINGGRGAGGRQESKRALNHSPWYWRAEAGAGVPGALAKAQDHVSDATDNPRKAAWPLSGCQLKDHPTQGPHRKQDAGGSGDQTQEHRRGQLGPMGGVPGMTWSEPSEENPLGETQQG